MLRIGGSNISYMDHSGTIKRMVLTDRMLMPKMVTKAIQKKFREKKWV